MKVTHLNPLPVPSFVCHSVDLCAEIKTAWATVISRPSVNCGLPNGSGVFPLNLYVWAKRLSFSPSLPSPPSLPPLLFLGRCCRAYWRSTAASYQTGTQVKAKPDVPSPLNTPVSHTRAHTQASTQSWEATEHSQWEWPVGGNAGEWMLSGGGHICLFPSVFWFVFFSCALRTSVSSERNCRLHVHSLLMSFT